MAILNSGDIIQQWKYHIENLNIFIGNKKTMTVDTVEIDPKRFKEFSIEENYEEDFFPIIKLTVIVSANTYYKIKNNKDTCKVYLNMTKYFIKSDDIEPSVKKKYINNVFTLIMDEDTDDMYKSVKEDESKNDYEKRISDEDNTLDSDDQNEISFYLFQDIDGTKGIVNRILDKANVSDAISFLALSAGYRNLVMAQPDNITIYDQLLIPSMSIIKAFSFIDYYFGLYKTGSMIWFGIDYTYIIPFCAECKAWTKNEKKVTNIIIRKSSNNSEVSSLGTLKKRGDNLSHYIIANYDAINVQNESISNNYINANDIQSVDSYDGDIETVSSGAKAKTSNFLKIYENKTENKFIATSYAAQTNAKSFVISIHLQDFDVSAITPNKKFCVISEDTNYIKKYKGNYIISGATHAFLKEGEDFSVNSTIVLKKEK